jgi:hypothetical protein
MQGAAIAGIFFANERKVILHRAGRYTSLTARAYILVNDHPPFTIRFFSNRPFRAHTI